MTGPFLPCAKILERNVQSHAHTAVTHRKSQKIPVKDNQGKVNGLVKEETRRQAEATSAPGTAGRGTGRPEPKRQEALGGPFIL